MSYPYGQPEYPGQGQPGYPQQGYPQMSFGYPQPSHPVHPGGNPTPPVSGATAITAAVLALIAGALAGLGGLLMIIFGTAVKSTNSAEDDYYSSSLDDTSTTAIGVGIFVIVLGVLWFVGAVLLLARKTAGRVMLIVFTAIGMVGAVVGMVTDPGVSDLIGLAFGGLILVLAVVPPTGRWIAAGGNPPPAVPGYMPYPYA